MLAHLRGRVFGCHTIDPGSLVGSPILIKVNGRYFRRGEISCRVTSYKPLVSLARRRVQNIAAARVYDLAFNHTVFKSFFALDSLPLNFFGFLVIAPTLRLSYSISQ